MKIPKAIESYFELIPENQRKTLSDSQTKLFIRAKHDVYCVTVDKGIVQDDAPKKINVITLFTMKKTCSVI